MLFQSIAAEFLIKHTIHIKFCIEPQQKEYIGTENIILNLCSDTESKQ